MNSYFNFYSQFIFMVFYCHIPLPPFILQRAVSISKTLTLHHIVKHFLPFATCLLVSWFCFCDIQTFLIFIRSNLYIFSLLLVCSINLCSTQIREAYSCVFSTRFFSVLFLPFASFIHLEGIWVQSMGQSSDLFFSKKTPFSPSNGCGFYLEADGESLKKAEQGRDVVRFALREGYCLWYLEVHTDGSPGCGCPEAPPIIPVAFPSSWKVAFGFHRLEKIHRHFGNSSGKCIKSLLRFSKKLTGDI